MHIAVETWITVQAIVILGSRVGKAVKAKDLGYMLHLAVNAKSELPVAMVVASAKENEKKHSCCLFERGSSKVKFKKLVADPQYSSQGLRDAVASMGTVPVISYPSNQKIGVRGVLRVDRKFRSMDHNS